MALLQAAHENRADVSVGVSRDDGAASGGAPAEYGRNSAHHALADPTGWDATPKGSSDSHHRATVRAQSAGPISYEIVTQPPAKGYYARPPAKMFGHGVQLTHGQCVCGPDGLMI